MIKNIVYDFGGVLVLYDFKTFFSRVLGSEEKARWFLQNVFPGDLNNEIDLGLHEPPYYFERQKQRWPESSKALEALETRYADIFTRVPEGMKASMAALKERGYRLLGLSNWSSLVFKVMDKFDIFTMLEGYLLSKDVHQLKPYEDIYESFFAKFGVKADECVFIDDKPENISGARQAGMYGIVYKDVAQLEHELQPLLLPYTFEPARPEDEDEVWQIVHSAALEMVEKGRHQWDETYPPREAVTGDIEAGHGYVLRINGEIAAYEALTFDGEPAYNEIGEAWLNPGPYATLHRTAVAHSHRGKGLSRLLLVEAERLARANSMDSMRIDTNHDNTEMLGLIEGFGFERRGLCHYLHGGQRVERIAYEYPLPRYGEKTRVEAWE